MKFTVILPILALLICGVAIGLSIPSKGLELYNTHCSKCHGVIDLNDLSSWNDPTNFNSKIKELAESGKNLDEYFTEKYSLSLSEYIAKKMVPLTRASLSKEDIDNIVNLYNYIYQSYVSETPTPTNTVNNSNSSLITITEKVIEIKTTTKTITQTKLETVTMTYVVKKTITKPATGETELATLVISVALIIGLSIFLSSTKR